MGAISRRVVQLFKEYYGRGPTKAKTYYADDVLTVLMSGGFSKAEETLLEGGRGDSVVQQRTDFHEVMKARFSAVVEEELDRKVVALLFANQQNPDLLVQTYLLEPFDGGLLDDPLASVEP